MKLIIVAAAFLVLVAARPQTKDGEDHEYSPENFRFRTSNGVIRYDDPIVRNAGTDEEEIERRGTITWTDVDGRESSIVFVAGKDGFVPKP